MIEEDKKAIERCKELIQPEHSGWIGITNQLAIETVIKKYEKQQSELEKKDKQINSKKGTINALQNALKERTEERDRKDNVISRQNKIIDEMTGYIATLDIEEDICSKIENEHCDKMNFGECEDCIKQYFERKVK